MSWPTKGLAYDRRFQIGCLVFVVIFWVGVPLTITFLMADGKRSAIDLSNKIYTLASVDDYKNLQPLLSSDGILALQQAEKENGKVTSWRTLKTETAVEILGRPAEAHVHIVRNGKRYVSTININGPVAFILVEVPEEDWKTHDFSHAITGRRRYVDTPTNAGQPK